MGQAVVGGWTFLYSVCSLSYESTSCTHTSLPCVIYFIKTSIVRYCS